jgi:PAS domain S-box-containing protein
MGWRFVPLLMVACLLPARPCASAAPDQPSHATEKIVLTAPERDWLDRHRTVRVRISSNYPPFEFFDNGRFQGMGMDYLDLVSRKLDVEFQPVFSDLTWAQVLDRFRSGEGVDLILGITRTPEREKFIAFTDNYISFPQVIFARKDSPFISGVRDLSGLRVAIERGCVMHRWLRRDVPTINFIEVDTTEDAIAAVSTGKAEAYVGNLANASYLIERQGFVNLKVAAPTIYGPDALAMGVRKDWPELADLITRAVRSISEEEHRAIRQRWLSLRYEFGIRRGDVVLWVLLVAVLGFAAIAYLRAVIKRRSRELARKAQLHASSERRFATLFQNVADPVFIADTAGHIIATNEQASRETGYSPEELLRMNVTDIDVSDEAEKVEAHLQEYFARKVLTSEAVYRRKDGSRFPVEINIRTIEYDGHPAILEVARNITERKRNEGEKVALQEQLQQAMKMEAIGRLAGGVAHDFNNLLTAILGNVFLAQRKLPSSDPAVGFLVEAKKAAERAAALTQQLLAFSRKQIIEPRNTDLNELVTGLQTMLARLIGENIELKFLPGADLGLVKVDFGQIEQVLVNLAVNSRDAMREGGKLLIETANVDLDEEYCARHPNVRPGRYVMLAVGDTGQGMSGEIKGKIFEPFFTTKPKGTGTGLGLATTYGVVKQSGGFIDVNSEVRKGTTFKIYLPRVEGIAERPRESGLPVELPEGSETVFLVEDDELVRKQGAQILEQLGYRVTQAGNGDEAIALAMEHGARIDLLMTDVVMPGMHGRELANRMTRIHPEARVLFTSGYTDDVIVHHGVLDEGVSFIGKPYSPSILAKKLREVLDKA